MSRAVRVEPLDLACDDALGPEAAAEITRLKLLRPKSGVESRLLHRLDQWYDV